MSGFSVSLPGDGVDGVAVQPLLRTATVAVNRWTCVVGPRGSTAELQQPWHLFSFTHIGAFVAHLGETTQTVDATRVLIIEPRHLYRMSKRYGSDASGSCLVIRPDVVESVVARARRSTVTDGELSARAYLAQHLLLRRLALDGDDALAVEEMAMHVIEDALAADSTAMLRDSTALRKKSRESVAAARAILLMHYRQPPQLDELARAVGLSPYHLCRAFKQETGMPMHRYLNRVRLRAALERVAERDVDLSTLAHELGFSSHSHFAEAFRHEFNVSPSEVRRLAMTRAKASGL